MFAFVRRILSILTLSICCGWSATLEIAPGNRVLISVPSFTGQRLAVDASSNLLNWSEITNTPASAAATPLVVEDPDGAGQTKRFFRLADADESFEVKGFVRGPQGFGAMAGARIIATKDGGFTETVSDANGFFHFDQRFARANFPVSLAAYGPAGSVEKFVDPAEAGVFVPFELPLAPLPPFVPLVGGKYNFSVKSGPRAGETFSISYTRDRFQMTGDLTRHGIFHGQSNPTQFMFRFDDSSAWNQMLLWSSSNTNEFLFAGIPSTNGVLPGNGVVTVTQPLFHAPAQLGTIHMVYPFEGGPGPAFSLVFSGGASGQFFVMNGVAPFPAQSGSFEYATFGSAAHLQLGFGSENPSTRGFELYFMNESLGSFQTQGSVSSGNFSYSTNVIEVAPDTLEGRSYLLGDYTLTFAGQTFTLSSPSIETVQGTVQFTRNGNQIVAKLESWCCGSTTGIVIITHGTATFTFQTAETGHVSLNHGQIPPYSGSFQQAPAQNTAPPFLRSVQLKYSQSLFGPATVTITLNGGASGTFMVGGEAIGHGNYTYTPSGETARLRLDYTGDFQGDFDDLLLRFAPDPNPQSGHSFTGTQRVGSMDGACLGTFNYFAP